MKKNVKDVTKHTAPTTTAVVETPAFVETPTADTTETAKDKTALSGYPKSESYKTFVSPILADFRKNREDIINNALLSYFRDSVETAIRDNADSLLSRLVDVTRDNEGNAWKVFPRRVVCEKDVQLSEGATLIRTTPVGGYVWYFESRDLSVDDLGGKSNVLSRCYDYLYATDIEVRKQVREKDKEVKNAVNDMINSARVSGVDMSNMSAEFAEFLKWKQQQNAE